MSNHPASCWRRFQWNHLKTFMHPITLFPQCVIVYCVCAMRDKLGKAGNSLQKSRKPMQGKKIIWEWGNILSNNQGSALPLQCLFGANFKNCSSPCSSTEICQCYVIYFLVQADVCSVFQLGTGWLKSWITTVCGHMCDKIKRLFKSGRSRQWGISHRPVNPDIVVCQGPVTRPFSLLGLPGLAWLLKAAKGLPQVVVTLFKLSRSRGWNSSCSKLHLLAKNAIKPHAQRNWIVWGAGLNRADSHWRIKPWVVFWKYCSFNLLVFKGSSL